MDRDISLSLDPFPRPGSAEPAAVVAPTPAPIAAPAPPPPVEIDPAALPESLWRSLARHELLVLILLELDVWLLDTCVDAGVLELELLETVRARALAILAFPM